VPGTVRHECTGRRRALAWRGRQALPDDGDWHVELIDRAELGIITHQRAGEETPAP
jgi:hypothetical protein